VCGRLLQAAFGRFLTNRIWPAKVASFTQNPD
jgi:hypothetical protein